MQKMITEFWIEKGWGESVDNATIEDTKIAIEEILKVSEELGTFWLGHIEKEYVLEIHNNLDLLFIYGENQDKKIKTKLGTWGECLHFVQMYFTSEFLILKQEIKSKTSFNI